MVDKFVQRVMLANYLQHLPCYSDLYEGSSVSSVS